MLTLLILSAYLSRRIDASREDGSAFLTLDYCRIWQDLVWVFGLIGLICQKSIKLGNGFRAYFNGELQPWLQRHNVNVSLPSLDLPRLPGRTEPTA